MVPFKISRWYRFWYFLSPLLMFFTLAFFYSLPHICFLATASVWSMILLNLFWGLTDLSFTDRSLLSINCEIIVSQSSKLAMTSRIFGPRGDRHMSQAQGLLSSLFIDTLFLFVTRSPIVGLKKFWLGLLTTSTIILPETTTWTLYWRARRDFIADWGAFVGRFRRHGRKLAHIITFPQPPHEPPKSIH